MKLSIHDKKVMGKVIRYFRSLEEMAAYMGIDLDDLISKLKNQTIHLHLEKRSMYNISRQRIFKEAADRKSSSVAI